MITVPILNVLFRRPQIHSNISRPSKTTSISQPNINNREKSCKNCKFLNDCASPFHGTCKEFEFNN